MLNFSGMQRKFSLILFLLGVAGLIYGSWQWWTIQQSLTGEIPAGLERIQFRVPRMILMISGTTIVYGVLRYALTCRRANDDTSNEGGR